MPEDKTPEAGLNEDVMMTEPQSRKRTRESPGEPSRGSSPASRAQNVTPMSKPRPKGALRGLDPGNVLTLSATQSSIERGNHDEDGHQEGVQSSSHNTRASRNGRPDVNYSSKFHPMDIVTRPRRASRMSGSRSVSVGIKRHEDDDSSSDSAAEDVDVDLSDGSQSVSSATLSPVLTQRTPDPKATRRSARTEAHKPVDYSRKRHPQDSRLPGYQHLARARKPANRESRASNGNGDPDVASQSHEVIAVTSGDQEESDEEQPPKDPPRPRKKLKSLARGEDISSKLNQRTAREATSDGTSSQVDDILLGRHLRRSKACPDNAEHSEHQTETDTASLMKTMDDLVDFSAHQDDGAAINFASHDTPAEPAESIDESHQPQTIKLAIVRPYMTVNPQSVILPAPAPTAEGTLGGLQSPRSMNDTDRLERTRQRLMASTRGNAPFSPDGISQQDSLDFLAPPSAQPAPPMAPEPYSGRETISIHDPPSDSLHQGDLSAGKVQDNPPVGSFEQRITVLAPHERRNGTFDDPSSATMRHSSRTMQTPEGTGQTSSTQQRAVSPSHLDGGQAQEAQTGINGGHVLQSRAVTTAANQISGAIFSARQDVQVQPSTDDEYFSCSNPTGYDDLNNEMTAFDQLWHEER